MSERNLPLSAFEVMVHCNCAVVGRIVRWKWSVNCEGESQLAKRRFVMRDFCWPPGTTRTAGRGNSNCSFCDGRRLAFVAGDCGNVGYIKVREFE